MEEWVFCFFSTFKDSLFAVNQSLMFTSSLERNYKEVFNVLMIKEKISIIRKYIGSNKRDAFSRSLTYTRNRIGPRIDPWGRNKQHI